MANWTAIPVGSVPISPVDIVEMYDISVQFNSDDARTTTRTFRLTTQAQLASVIQNQLASFNAIDLATLVLQTPK